MDKLTKRQTEILELIQRRVDETGFPPTRAEIANELGFKSANAAEDHLKALSRKGAIEMISGTSRGIRVLRNPFGDHEAGLPIIGEVAAGSPVLATENIDKHLELPKKLFSPNAHYLLRVKGLSMMKIGIMDGDLLAVHKTREAKSGDIVVARLLDEVTVKRLQKNTDHIALLPENDDFNPIIIENDTDFEIEGLGVGIIRQQGL